MNSQEKLVFFRECCQYAVEYKSRNKLAFEEMIREILKGQTGYNFKEPRNAVRRWVADRRKDLVLKKIGSGIQVD